MDQGAPSGLMDRVQPLLLITGRIALGSTLSIVFSVAGILVAWGVYVFASATSRDALLIMFTAGAGLGAGVGGFAAWLKLDSYSRPAVIGTLLLALLAGVAGAWGGYEFGANQEVACCAKPDISPLAYMALGGTVLANGVAALLFIARDIREVKRRGYIRAP